MMQITSVLPSNESYYDDIRLKLKEIYTEKLLQKENFCLNELIFRDKSPEVGENKRCDHIFISLIPNVFYQQFSIFALLLYS